MAKVGRPKLNIDYDMVAKLTYIHCTEAEIAEVLGISVRTLQRNAEFCRIYKKGIEEAKISLRRLQWKKAEGIEAVLAKDDDGRILKNDKGRPIVLLPGSAPDTTMMIWLGKQYLGQTDKQDIEHAGKGGEPLTIRVVSDQAKKATEAILAGEGTE